MQGQHWQHLDVAPAGCANVFWIALCGFCGQVRSYAPCGVTSHRNFHHPIAISGIIQMDAHKEHFGEKHNGWFTVPSLMVKKAFLSLLLTTWQCPLHSFTKFLDFTTQNGVPKAISAWRQSNTPYDPATDYHPARGTCSSTAPASRRRVRSTRHRI